jgi:hypothetical protein
MWVVKLRTMRLEGYVARTGEMKNPYNMENLKGRGHSEDLGVDRRIILKWI